MAGTEQRELLAARASAASRAQHDPVRAAASLVAAAVLSVALPVYLVVDVDDVGRSNGWWITLGVMVWSGVRLARICVDGRPQLFEFFFWLYAYVFLGLGATVQIRADAVSGTTPGMDPAVDVPTALIVVLGLVMYELGRWGARSFRRDGSRVAHSVARHWEVSPARSLALVFVGLLFTAFYFSRVGLIVFAGSRDAAAQAREAAWPDPAIRNIVFALAVYTILIGAGALAQSRDSAASPGWRGTARFVLPVSVLLLLLEVNPVISARYTFGTVAFALAVYLGALRTPFRVRATMLGTVFGFLFVFPLADIFRRADSVSQARTSFFAEYPFNPDYDSFWQIANAYMFWLDGLVVPLRQILGSLLFWLPRAFWADKPTDTGIMLADYRGYSVDNLSAPLWAEALVNGGVVAVVVVFLVVGYALCRMDARIPRALSHGGPWAVVAAAFPVYMTILLRGSLLQATGTLAVSIACILFVSRRPPPRPRHRPARYTDSS